MYLYLFTSMAWKFICTVCSTVLQARNLFVSFSRQTGLLRFMQGLQQAKLNLFADKRLCHRDSSKCLSEGHNVQE